MTDLYVVRHGETEWSKSGRHTSVTDLSLTDAGLGQAERLQGRLDPDQFGLVLSSPRLRARQTAERAGFVGNASPVTDPNLAEWHYGDYEGRTSAEIHRDRPDWQLWTDGCPGGETPQEVVERINRVIERVRDSEVGQAICFGHGHALRVLALCWLDLELSRGDQFPLTTGTVSVLGTAKGQPALLRWNAPS